MRVRARHVPRNDEEKAEFAWFLRARGQTPAKYGLLPHPRD
ncbi:hypothetical protein ABIF44_002294 [Bradyrhizobium japonicum]|nr:hypothetical protein [Bradyrhizobium japonicum]MCS3991401.1 hypothetical protein [Bradyrhizobium japonicum]MCS4013790.1 hypothetical protein [Bradyrhizobium japonicum]MCS4209796.1 hypothetical protein [Bradyrhizobium japonicum]MDH6171732.1 hypothetical protein [Bradyrhizobium japonicum]